jgi:hypothetical protein
MQSLNPTETMLTGKSRTWTFEPDPAVRSLIRKAMVRTVGRNNINNPKATRGLRSKFINEAIRQHFAGLNGKREAAKN